MKFKILEKVVDSFPAKYYGEAEQTYFIYQNPTPTELNSKEDSKDNCAIILPSGDLYMEAMWIKDENENPRSEMIYDGLLVWARDHGFLGKYDENWWQNINSPKTVLCMQRYEDTKTFYIGESYDEEILDINEDIIKKYFEICKKKNPYLTFKTSTICWADGE